ncbi:hypothetical protein [Chitinophaga barathri]|uniref:Uncharacterized protein n=1 Tax=Chitinophaga barathri TaxID=1647451 RepID=A0A3N4N2B6_9BACT|nr:hypothetical protein [Chitinophaga barathri]RPD41773.1 hypothetical protein EG028_06290 [Chitinophaga barathri]
MKTLTDIIYREPKPGESGKPGIFTFVNLGAIIYLVYLFDNGHRFSGIDWFLLPGFMLAIGVQVFLFLKKKKQ